MIVSKSEFFNNRDRKAEDKFWSGPDSQFALMKIIGDTSREYVIAKHSDAEARYKRVRGKRKFVGIYATGGVDIDEQENYCKQQHRMQLLAPLVTYVSAPGNYLVEHNTEAWTLCAASLRKQHNESTDDNHLLFILDWLESLKLAAFPHVTP